ncbi:MAG: tetratricopeptide repeat protein, partial [Bacteroidota bacterium]
MRVVLHHFLLLSIGLSLSNCIQTESSEGTNGAPDSVALLSDSLATDQIMSLLGEPLPPKAFEGTERMRRERMLARAKEQYEQNPDSLESIIWYGRRLAHLGRYSEAITVYSDGLTRHPDSHKLLRHRGEALITARAFDQAMHDLENAAFFSLMEENEKELAVSGAGANKPIRNIRFSIWYHLGLAYYLRGNFDKAISAYKKSLTESDNDDLRVATLAWLYRTYIRIGNQAEADALLEDVSPNMRLVENRDYLNILLLFKKELSPERLYELASRRDNSLDPTVGYGLANYYALQGEIQTASETFD